MYIGRTVYMINFANAASAITIEDIISAAVWALIITMFIRGFSRFFRVMKSPMDAIYKSGEIADVLKKYYLLFPKDIFTFKGQTVQRGMIVRVTTLKKKVFEGKLVGLSSDNVICIITQKHVIAQGLDDVEEISVIEA
jgi:hypothetical protein